MTRRLIGNLVLGLVLGGCTVTNTIQTTVSLSQDEEGRVVTHTADRPSPKEITVLQDTPDTAKTEKRSRLEKAVDKMNQMDPYCNMYIPLTIPEPLKYDKEAYLQAVDEENYAKATNVMKDNVVALVKQMNEYKINQQRHQEAWKKRCGIR